MKKRADRFAIGYEGSKQVAYGREEATLSGGRMPTYAIPMTIEQAKKAAKNLGNGHEAILYELVPVHSKTRGKGK